MAGTTPRNQSGHHTSHYTPFSLTRLAGMFSRPKLQPRGTGGEDDDWVAVAAHPAATSTSSFGGGDMRASGSVRRAGGGGGDWAFATTFSAPVHRPLNPPQIITDFTNIPPNHHHQQTRGSGSGLLPRSPAMNTFFPTNSPSLAGPSSRIANKDRRAMNHYRKASIDAGIGESPVAASTKGKAREIYLPRDISTPTTTTTTKRESALATLVKRTSGTISPSPSHQHQHPSRPMGVRTSLLGFGTPILSDSGASSMSDEGEFGVLPRKAPLPPGYGHSTLTTTEGTLSTLGPVREVSAESTLRSHRVPAPLLEEDIRDPDPLKVATGVPLPQSASEYSPGMSSKLPSPISQSQRPSPQKPPPPTFTRSFHTPKHSISTDTHGTKPPIPPKSPDNFATLSRNNTTRTLKGSTSTPNLMSRALALGNATNRPLLTPQNQHTNPSRYLQVPQPSNSSGHMLQAQTICDAFMFPKPRFVAHAISPPPTPPTTAPPVLPEIQIGLMSLEKVIRDGENREREREEWAKVGRNRSLSVRRGGTSSADGEKGESGGGLVGRLRSRTLSGKRSGKDKEKEKDRAERMVNEKRSYQDLFFTQRGRTPTEHGHGVGTIRSEVWRGVQVQSPASSQYQNQHQQRPGSARSNTAPSPIPRAFGMGLGRQGKLSISTTGAGEGTVRSNTSNQSQAQTHSRKSSSSQPNPVGHNHKGGQHSRSGSTSGSISIAASNVLRKVKSLCGPDEQVSPGTDGGESFLAGPGLRANPKERFTRGVVHDEGGLAAGDPQQGLVVDISRPRLSPKVEVSHEDDGEEDDEDYGQEVVKTASKSPSPSRPSPSPPARMRMEEIGGRLSAVPSSTSGGAQDDMDAASHLDLEDDEPEHEQDPDDETAQIQQVTRRVSMTPAQLSSSSRQSIAAAHQFHHQSIPIDFTRPVPTPSPSPSSYHGVYGIALGTPSSSGANPFALDDDHDEVQYAGPHPTSPTYLQIPVPWRGGRSPAWPPPTGSLPSPPRTTEQHDDYSPPSAYEVEEEDVSMRPIYPVSDVEDMEMEVEGASMRPMYVRTAPASPATGMRTPLTPGTRTPLHPFASGRSSPATGGGRHPFAARPTSTIFSPEDELSMQHQLDPSSIRPMYARTSGRTSPATGTGARTPLHPFASYGAGQQSSKRNTVNSVEAMFGGEMMESARTVSPLGVSGWVPSAMEQDEQDTRYHHQQPEEREEEDRSFLSRPPPATSISATSVPKSAGKQSRMSTATMLVESPPPSMFPSSSRRESSRFDTMTFGNPDGLGVDDEDLDEDLSVYEDEDATAIPPPAARTRTPSAASSSTTSSGDLPLKPLGSSDDMESFKNLFYVPRSRQPSGEASPKSPSEQSYHPVPPPPTAPTAGGYSSSPSTRILSPLSSVLQMRDSFPDIEVAGPYPHRPMSYQSYESPFPQRASMIDTIEEEGSVRSSVERFTEEDVRYGAINALSPTMNTGVMHQRASTQPSLVGPDVDIDIDLDDQSLLDPLPNNLPLARVPRPTFIDEDPRYRQSYLSTTSGTSAGGPRMSHIISDFPSPPPLLSTPSTPSHRHSPPS